MKNYLSVLTLLLLASSQGFSQSQVKYGDFPPFGVNLGLHAVGGAGFWAGKGGKAAWEFQTMVSENILPIQK